MAVQGQISYYFIFLSYVLNSLYAYVFVQFEIHLVGRVYMGERASICRYRQLLHMLFEDMIVQLLKCREAFTAKYCTDVLFKCRCFQNEVLQLNTYLNHFHQYICGEH